MQLAVFPPASLCQIEISQIHSKSQSTGNTKVRFLIYMCISVSVSWNVNKKFICFKMQIQFCLLLFMQNYNPSIDTVYVNIIILHSSRPRISFKIASRQVFHFNVYCQNLKVQLYYSSLHYYIPPCSREDHRLTTSKTRRE